ncbi:MAG TPA: GNAT family N-acetyltransferase [Pseudonocardiaceae bacterium]
MFALDHPTWAALNGAQAGFAQWQGRVVRYQSDVAPFLAIPPEPAEQAAMWDDLAALAGPGAVVVLTGVRAPLPDWEVAQWVPGVQMVGEDIAAEEDPEAIRLTEADLPEMLDLVERTKPGPFLPRTIQLGSYLGIRRDGVLVAMAGERRRPPGCTEISAVCTDESVRGQGLATRLVRAVTAGIQARGETPFLAAAATNTNAIRLYETLGFRLRKRPNLTALRVPATTR